MRKPGLHENLLAALLCMSIAPGLAAQKKASGTQDQPPATVAEPTAETFKIPPERAETTRGKHLQQQIEQTDPQTKVSWLGVKPDQFLALYRADSSRKTYASLILLHDNQQHPDWPGLVHQIRTQLAQQGWNTLSIAVPDMVANEVLPAIKPPTPLAEESAVEPGSPAAAEVDLDDLAEDEAAEYPIKVVPEKLAQRIQEATRLLTTQSRFPIFIAAIGSSATLLLQQQSPLMASQTLSGAVLIDAAPAPKMDSKQAGQSEIEIPGFPVLDLVPQFNQRSNPRLRKNEATQRNRNDYQQRIIPGASENFDQFEKVVIKAIRGWAINLLKNDRNDF